MSLTGFNFFLLYMGLGLATGLCVPLVLIMHFLMPRVVLEHYWKGPYFRRAELALFTNTVYAPMRTVMLMGGIAFSSLGRKRKITDIHMLVPAWYRIAAKVICIWVLASTASILAMTVGVFIYGYVIGDPVPLTRGK